VLTARQREVLTLLAKGSSNRRPGEGRRRGHQPRAINFVVKYLLTVMMGVMVWLEELEGNPDESNT